jgi:hypothetical protein
LPLVVGRRDDGDKWIWHEWPRSRFARPGCQ